MLSTHGPTPPEWQALSTAAAPSAAMRGRTLVFITTPCSGEPSGLYKILPLELGKDTAVEPLVNHGATPSSPLTHAPRDLDSAAELLGKMAKARCENVV